MEKHFFFFPEDESPLPVNTSLFVRNAEPIPDPLSKLHLHLHETSDFVKSFPTMLHRNRGFLEVSSQRKTRIEAPSSPGRPFFSFRNSNFSSKWEDAEKWIIGSHGSLASASSKIRTSSDNVFKLGNIDEGFSEKPRIIQGKVSRDVPTFEISHATLDHHEFPSPTDMALKDKFTEKKGSKFPNFRDIGTEMTPLGSSKTSMCHTPLKSLSPARHNTPANSSASFNNIRCCTSDLIQLQLATKFDSIVSNWSSREEEEEEASKSLRFHACQTQKADSDPITSAWEEEEKIQSCLRYQIEEAKIRAWVNLQSAKAQAESKKLEVKIEKMRWNHEEKLMRRMEGVQRKAKEWREAAREQHMMEKAHEESHQKLLKNPFSCYAPSCGCFPCTNVMK